MSDEPFGHRGHPTSGEEYRARGTAARLGATITILCEGGFTHGEAVSFISGVCLEISRDRGESWGSVHTARFTVENLLAGRAAKHWSLDVIDIALGTVHDLLRDP